MCLVQDRFTRFGNAVQNGTNLTNDSRWLITCSKHPYSVFVAYNNRLKMPEIELFCKKAKRVRSFLYFGSNMSCRPIFYKNLIEVFHVLFFLTHVDVQKNRITIKIIFPLYLRVNLCHWSNFHFTMLAKVAICLDTTDLGYTRGHNCWYPSANDHKTDNNHWNVLKLTKGPIQIKNSWQWTSENQSLLLE